MLAASRDQQQKLDDLQDRSDSKVIRERSGLVLARIGFAGARRFGLSHRGFMDAAGGGGSGGSGGWAPVRVVAARRLASTPKQACAVKKRGSWSRPLRQMALALLCGYALASVLSIGYLVVTCGTGLLQRYWAVDFQVGEKRRRFINKACSYFIS